MDKVTINLKELEENIPRNEQGDPLFLQLGEFLKPEDRNPKGDLVPPTVLDVFTPEQVVALVNRALYQMEYSRTAHRNRAQRERDLMKPIKELLKQKFPGISWINATEWQINECMEEFKRLQDASKKVEASHG